MAWAIVNAIGIDFVKDADRSSIKSNVSSWTAFMKDTSDSITEKSKIEYLPVIPFPPEDNIVKYYLDMINDLMEELGLNHVFSMLMKLSIAKYT